MKKDKTDILHLSVLLFSVIHCSAFYFSSLFNASSVISSVIHFISLFSLFSVFSLSVLSVFSQCYQCLVLYFALQSSTHLFPFHCCFFSLTFNHFLIPLSFFSVSVSSLFGQLKYYSVSLVQFFIWCFHKSSLILILQPYFVS